MEMMNGEDIATLRCKTGEKRMNKIEERIVKIEKRLDALEKELRPAKEEVIRSLHEANEEFQEYIARQIKQ